MAITLRKPFEFIFESKETIENELSKVRTSKNIVKTKQFADIWANCPSWRKGWDSNPRAPCGAPPFQGGGMNHYPTLPLILILIYYILFTLSIINRTASFILVEVMSIFGYLDLKTLNISSANA